MCVSSNNYQEKLGFRQSQIELCSNNTNLATTSLYIPSSAINKSKCKNTIVNISQQQLRNKGIS